MADGEGGLVPYLNDYGLPVFLDPATGAPRIVRFTDGGRMLFNDTGQPAQSKFGNPFLFNGRTWDPELSQYDYRTRHLDPLTGRFTTLDTIGIWGDPMNFGNGYAYLGNNPWNTIDPYGTMPEWAGRAGRMALVGTVVGVNVAAWSLTGPVLGLPATYITAIGTAVTGTTVAVGAYSSYTSRLEQYQQATGQVLSDQDAMFIVAGDVSGGSAAYSIFSGTDPLTGAKVSSADRAEMAVALAVAIASGAAARAGSEAIAARITSQTNSALPCPSPNSVSSTGTRLMDPNRIRFSQDSMSYNFQKGFGTIDELAAGLRSGTISPDEIPPIRLVDVEINLITIDNRRLEAFRRAGMEIPTRMATLDEYLTAIRHPKFTAGAYGSPTINIRGQSR